MKTKKIKPIVSPPDKVTKNGNKDIGLALNNAVSAAWSYPTLAKTPDLRRKALRNYLAAILDKILEHRKEGHLTAEELVAVLASGALFVHAFLIQKSGRLPMFEDIAARMAQDLDTEGK